MNVALICTNLPAKYLQIGFTFMATTKLYLDARATAKGKPAPLKLAITKNGKTALLHLNVTLLPEQWDKKAGKVTNHPNKMFLNTYIARRKLDADSILLKLIETGEYAKMKVIELKNHIERMYKGEPEEETVSMDRLFSYRLKKFAENKKESTKGVYLHTYNRMKAFAPDLDKLTFEDITKEWLVSFEAFLAKTAPSKNARNIHLRNIRAVFNDAIEDEATNVYPFRRFKIRPVATAKRSLTVAQLRKLFNYPVEEYAVRHLDMFKLIFYLIGINTVDLFNLKEITNDGRIEFYRAKTGRLYSIKVEPEAMDLISKYRGQEYLLNIHDTCENHHYYAKRLNKALKRIGETTVGKHGAKTFKPIFPELTTYWARHTWATIAAELEIPKETIAAALGHGGNTVTDIYIDFDRKKIDNANRKVLDWVLYGKR